MPPREVLNRRRKEEIDRNEGVQIRQCAEKIEKLANLVKKRDVKAAESMVKISIELANIYQQVILPDVIYSFTAGLEQKLFRQAFYRTIEVLRSGANSADPDSKRIRAVLQKLLLNGILFYEQLIRQYEQEFHVELDTALTWPSGSPTSSELVENCINLPVGIQKFESAIQKTAIKSLSRHLISLGDFHRYKSLVDGSENYEVSKTYYQKSAQLWPATGHPYNQLGVVVYYSMLYRSARRARLIPVDVLSAQRQKRVIDEFFYLMRSLACTHPYEAARDRLTQRLDAMRAKVGKYQPVLDKECGKVKSDAATLKKNMRLIRQIWIHPISQKVEDGTGERIVDDILSHFQAQSKTKLHRRAVSYLCDVFGILVTKIGMDHFQSVSERAFGLLYASLSKPETDFSPDQLVKLAAMSIYAVQVNFTKSDNLQVQIALNTLITFYTILIQNYLQDTNKTLLLPAIHVLSIWICHPETQVLEKTERLESLPSTILTDSAKNTILAVLEQIPAEKTVIDATKTYPEAILMASFFKCFEANPTGATFTTSGDLNSARLQAMRKAAERVRELVENEKVEDPPASTDSERLREEPRSRQQIMEEEREKGTVTIVTLPEYLIPDTNVLIGDLQLLKDLLDAKMYQILVPTTVIDELSHLAQPSSSTSTSDDAHDPERFSKARQALVWLREQAKLRTPGLHTLTTTGKRLATLILASEEVEAEKNTNNDDKILKSAIEWTNQLPTPPTSSPLHTVATQFQQADGNTGGGVQLKSCVLLTGDRGLTIKAVGSHVPCRTVENFVKWAVPGAQ
uniref:PINc domain-containing protein n=1 Tax=Caenorhabditis japonica TaxID=281687 RepID=A0A8R1DVY7_CAEJA